jgi:hypothetical protein
MTLEIDRIYCGDCCRVWAGVLSPEDEIRAIGI